MLILASCQSEPAQIERVRRGVIDLRGWNSVTRPIVRLDGDWEFFWNKLAEPDPERHIQPDAFVSVPGVWNQYSVRGDRLPGRGFATYRVTVLLPEGARKLSVLIPATPSSYKLWANRDLLIENGTVVTNESFNIPDYNPGIASWTRDTPSVVLTLQVANYSLIKGGIRDGISLGRSSDISRHRELSLVTESALLGIVMVVMFLLVVHRIAVRKPLTALASLVLFCLFLTAHTALTGETVTLFSFLNGEWIFRLNFFSLLVSAVALVLFQRHDLAWRAGSVLSIVFLSLYGFLAALTLTAPISWIAFTRYVVYPLLIAQESGVMVSLWIRPRHHSRWTRIVHLAGLAGLIGTLLYDYLSLLSEGTSPYGLPYGMTLLAVCILPEIVLQSMIRQNSAESLVQEFVSLREEKNRWERLHGKLKDKIRKIRLKEQNHLRNRAEFFNRFSEREREIIECLLDGLSYRDIAARLFISVKTVNNHAQNIYQKAGVRGRNRLIQYLKKLEPQKFVSG